MGQIGSDNSQQKAIQRSIRLIIELWKGLVSPYKTF